MRALVLLLTLFGLTTVASADVHASKIGKASIDIPKKWSVTAKDELVRAASPDSAIAIVFWVTDTTDTKEALKSLESELYSSIQGLKWVDRTKKLKINRLPATWVEGVGVNAAGKQLDVLVVIAGPTPAKKGITMFAVVEHEQLSKNRKTIQSIFQTLKPTK
jgi:hypothetical protein